MVKIKPFKYSKFGLVADKDKDVATIIDVHENTLDVIYLTPNKFDGEVKEVQKNDVKNVSNWYFAEEDSPLNDTKLIKEINVGDMFCWKGIYALKIKKDELYLVKVDNFGSKLNRIGFRPSYRFKIEKGSIFTPNTVVSPMAMEVFI
jgi:hypothetical protein